jgi:hypothetical protein
MLGEGNGRFLLTISGEGILLRFFAPAATKFSTPRDLQIAAFTMQFLATAGGDLLQDQNP